jgi:hypothetical protein
MLAHCGNLIHPSHHVYSRHSTVICQDVRTIAKTGRSADGECRVSWFRVAFFVILRARQLLLLGLQNIDTDVRAIFCVAAGMLVWYGIFMGFQPIYVSFHLPVLIGIIWGLAAQLLQAVDKQPVAMTFDIKSKSRSTL